MDIAVLLNMLEIAGFREREALALDAARTATAKDLTDLTAHLRHRHAGVRLGVIEVLAAAGHRAAMNDLVELATQRAGDDRVFAIRALARLATPQDTQLRPLVEQWRKSSDPFVQAQADALGAIISPVVREKPAAAPAQSVPAPVAEDASLAALLESRSDTERIKLVEHIAAQPAAAMVTAAGTALAKGNADVVALVARMLARQSVNIPEDARPTLATLLEATRRRHPHSPLAHAAIDACLLVVQPALQMETLLARLHELDDTDARELAKRLDALRTDELALLLPSAFGALRRRPAHFEWMAPTLQRAAVLLRPNARTELKRACVEISSSIPHRSAPGVLASLVGVMSLLADEGDPLPVSLLDALEKVPDAASWRAAAELCVRCGTEDAALRLVALTRDPVAAARDAANDALKRFHSNQVRVELQETGPVVTATYRAADGEELQARDGRLTHPKSGEEYLLDARSLPIRAKETEFGGCRCCLRPRVLMRSSGGVLRCPQSGEAHLLDGGKPILEKGHPLGRCRACESMRPLMRDGSRVYCPDCRTVHIRGQTGYVAAPRNAPPPSTENGGAASAQPAPQASPYLPAQETGLPRPPSRHDLQLIEPAIVRAMAANVFLVGKVEENQWWGSGVIVAREGNDFAILTNRHVVEDDDVTKVPVLSALTLAGELVPVQPVWLASMGVDLALVEVRLEKADAVHVMEIGHGACLVGSPMFAIGNPMGLSWSYSSGTLSAFRDWKTREGLDLRFLQAQVPIASGSSGGGLYHRDGHLVGLISFTRMRPFAGEAHFALGVASIVETLRKEGVTWRDRPLVAAA